MARSEGDEEAVRAWGIRAKVPDNPRDVVDLQARLTVLHLQGLLRFPWNVAGYSLLSDFLPAKRCVRQRGSIRSQPVNWTKMHIGRVYGVSMSV